MTAPLHRRARAASAALVLGAVFTLSSPALATTTAERLERGATTVLELNGGKAQAQLERMRQEFPFLAEATQAYALGDVWSRSELDNRTRQLAAVAAFAAIGETAFMKIHAGYALNTGVSEEELKEIIYMVTVPAGFPKAIRASHALSELFAERRAVTDEPPALHDTPRSR